MAQPNENDKRICRACVGEPYLRALIDKGGVAGKCSYCDKRRKSFSIPAMSDIVHTAFERHFRRSRMDMDGYEWAMHKDSESSYEFEPDGEPIIMAIMNAADIPEDAASDIQELLEERYSDFDSQQIGETTEYDSDLYYHEIMPSSRAWHDGWQSFERTLKSEARFFNPETAKFLHGVFDGISELRTQAGASLIIDAGPDTDITHLFRARPFQSPGKLKVAITRPDTELGPAPSLFAGSGRMNARGISVFYGATDPAVAVAEVRPPVGSHVAVGKFEIVRKLKLLDLTALDSLSKQGSIFDPNYADELSRVAFLRGLTLRVARPVMPDDQELDYLPTQAISDFLASGIIGPLDGIVFPSVQVEGPTKNVVLFRKASMVEVWKVPEDVEIEVSMDSSDEDGSYPDFSSFWWRKANEEQNSVEADDNDSEYWREFEQAVSNSIRPAQLTTLKISPADVEVRLINAVEYKTSDFTVQHSDFTAHQAAANKAF